MSSNVKYIVSYSEKYLDWEEYGLGKEEHFCFDSEEDAIETFKELGGPYVAMMDNTYNISYGGEKDTEPMIDIFITRIEIKIRGRKVRSELLRTDDDMRPDEEVIRRACTLECPNYECCPFSHVNEKYACQRIMIIKDEYYKELHEYLEFL